MELIKKYRKIAVITFIFFILFSILLFALVWNTLIQAGPGQNITKLILLILFVLITGFVLFYISVFLSGTQRTQAMLDSYMEKERSAMMQEQTESRDEEVQKKEEVNTKAEADNLIEKLDISKKAEDLAGRLLSIIAQQYEFVQGLVYLKKGRAKKYTCISKYAFTGKDEPADFLSGETLPGQAAANGHPIMIDEIPEDYFTVESGLGKAAPRHLLFIPLLDKNKTVGVIELASFKAIEDITMKILGNLGQKAGNKISKIK